MAGRIIAIVGETGSGKSDLAMKIAQTFNGEIICADAWTIRRGMDIGTAKSSLDDRQKVRHHLLDIVDVSQDFTVFQYQALAEQAIADIHQRKHLPIIVGGSGLYIDSILYNYSFRDVHSKYLRGELDKLDLSALLDLIKREGLNSKVVDAHNKRRLIRLLETNGQVAIKQPLRQGAFIIGLKVDRTVLKHRLETRLAQMLDQGLENEVKDLSQIYGWNHQALKGVDYAEWQDYFLGTIDKDEVKLRIIKDNLSLAKKQRTWFKRNKDIHWFSTPVNWPDIVDLITTLNDSRFN